MILKTQRLTLRKFTEQDLDDLAKLLGNAEVMRFSLNGQLNREQTEHYLKKRILAHYETHGFGAWAIIDKEGHFVGLSGLLTQVIDGEKLVELAFRLDPKFWGKGLATEAAKAICDYAFKELKISRLISIIEAENIRSIKVAERLGMHYWKDSLFHGIPVRIYSLE